MRLLQSVASILLVIFLLSLMIGDSLAKGLVQPEFTISFTDQERAWLKQHPVIRVGVDADFPPYEFVSQYNKHTGISSEYLKALSKVMGIRFEIASNLSWSEVLQNAKEKKIDLLPLVTASEERGKYLSFSAPYIRYQMAIVSSTDTNTARSLADLAGKKVALVTNYFASKQVLERQPDIQLRIPTHPAAYSALNRPPIPV